MYEIIKAKPIDRRPATNTPQSRFPFDELKVGEGFLVPNLKLDPPPELRDKASTLMNMQTHCNIRNKRKKHAGKVFKAALLPDNPCYIQVWREA